MTAAVRPGDRSGPKDPRYIPIGVPIPARIIKMPGNQALGISPILEPDEGITVEITEYLVSKVDDLTPADLVDCSPDVIFPSLVPWHLGLMYDQPPLKLEAAITIWRWRYVEPTR